MRRRRRYRIEEIGNDFGDAPFGSALKSKDYTTSGVPVIQGRNIKDNKFTWNQKLYVSEEKFASLKRSHCREGDLVFPKIGTIGVAAIMPKVEGRNTFLLSTNMMKMSVNKAIADIKYVYYFFCQSQVREYIRATAGGSSQPIFNFTTLKNFEIELPDLRAQLQVVSILSAYDDLIENNTRRIQILEEMARLIYEEWFVRFRFPGRENGKMIRSEVGLIPDGWEVSRLGALVSNVRKSTKAGPHLSERRYVPIECISRESLSLNEFFTWEEAQSSLILFEERDILFGAMRPYYHKVTVAPFQGVTRTTCLVLRPFVCFHHSFAVMTLFSKSTIGFATTNSKGATIPYAVWDGVMENMKVVLPPANLLERFDQIMKPILETIRKSIFKQQNLRRTRDLLLPKLISGEIDVSNFPDPSD